MARLCAVVYIFCTVAGTLFEEVIVGLDVLGEVNHFSGSQRFGRVKHNLLAKMVGTLEVPREALLADEFTAFGRISRRHLILRENGCVWALRDARAAVNAGIRVNVNPRPFFFWKTGNHAFYRADFYAAAIANA